MNILFLGEYSGFYNNLAEGFKQKGHNVTLISDGDNFKNYYRDFNIGSVNSNVLVRQIFRIYNELRFLKKMKGFDIVFLINPLVFSRFNFVKYILRYIIQNNKKVIYTVAGDDSIYWRAFREGKFVYSPHLGSLNDEGKSKSIWESRRCIKITKWFIKQDIKIVTCCIEYKLAYDSYKIPNILIPLPVSIKIYDSIHLSERINILHGVQTRRRGFKGNDIIDEAMNLIKQKYGPIISYTRIEDLPFNTYSKLLDNADIIFDQVFSYGPGMNALESMARRKVVIGGFESYHKDVFGISYDYIVNVKPDVKDIFNNLEYLLNNRELILEKKVRAEEYIRTFHNTDVVVEQYMNIINN